MSVSVLIKNAVKAKIQALSSVQFVATSEQINPEGWPAVFIRTVGVNGEFISNAENRRIYSFRITVLFPDGQKFVPDNEKNRQDYAEDVVATVVDEIINTIDTNFVLDGTPVLFVDAADSNYGEAAIENGIAKAAQVTISVSTDFTVL